MIDGTRIHDGVADGRYHYGTVADCRECMAELANDRLVNDPVNDVYGPAELVEVRPDECTCWATSRNGCPKHAR